MNLANRYRYQTAERSYHFATQQVTALPKKEAVLPEWQAGIEALILVVDHGRPTMFARIGVMRARCAGTFASPRKLGLHVNSKLNGACQNLYTLIDCFGCILSR